jgi:hypothetical protein
VAADKKISHFLPLTSEKQDCSKGTTMRLKIISRSFFMLPVLYGTLMSNAHADTLFDTLKNGGEAGRGEACLLVDRAGELAPSTTGITSIFKDVSKSINDFLSGDSLFCKRDIITVTLITGDQIDNAVYEAAQGLRDAYLALGYKEQDLKQLAEIQRQGLGERFSSQAMTATENNSNIISRQADSLRTAIKQQENYLSEQTMSKLTDALGKINAAAYNQTKALIGAYLVKEYLTRTPTQALPALALAGVQRGIDEEFLIKFPTRFIELGGNVGRTIYASSKAAEVLDNSQKEAIEIAAEKHSERVAKSSVVAANHIANGTNFANLPQVDNVLSDAPAPKKSLNSKKTESAKIQTKKKPVAKEPEKKEAETGGFWGSLKKGIDDVTSGKIEGVRSYENETNQDP